MRRDLHVSKAFRRHVLDQIALYLDSPAMQFPAVLPKSNRGCARDDRKTMQQDIHYGRSLDRLLVCQLIELAQFESHAQDVRFFTWCPMPVRLS